MFIWWTIHKQVQIFNSRIAGATHCDFSPQVSEDDSLEENIALKQMRLCPCKTPLLFFSLYVFAENRDLVDIKSQWHTCTIVDRAVSTLRMDERNSIPKMDSMSGKKYISRVEKIVTAEISRKNCSLYPVPKKLLSVAAELSTATYGKKLQYVSLAQQDVTDAAMELFNAGSSPRRLRGTAKCSLYKTLLLQIF